MSAEEIIQIIADNCLCVRRLPFEVISAWSYKEGDENLQYVDSSGNPIKSKREVVIVNYDLQHFINTKTAKWDTNTPEQRYNKWIKDYPNGKKILKETKTVDKGGWWYVKVVNDTYSTVTFNRKYDKFFAPTLEEAIQLYLNSKL